MHNDRNETKKQIWKSYAELADTDTYRKWADDEFPDREGLLDLDRRDFLKLTGAGMALAGLTGCRQFMMPDPKAVPFVRAPEGLVPGKSLLYATALSLGGYATGVLAVSHEGRPTKIEGNPAHPASLGSTDIFAQADILGLYDPERSQSVVERGEIKAWSDFTDALRNALKGEEATGGAGLRVVTEAVGSPTLAAQLEKLLKRFPNAKWVQWEPLARTAVHEGGVLAFGQPVNPIYRLKDATVVVALDADFLSAMPGSVRYARDFAAGRRVRKSTKTLNRLYAFESAYTITGASADHRFGVKPSEVEALARAMYSRLSGGSDPAPAGVPAPVLDGLVKDLREAGANAVVVPGDQVSAATHALVHGINAALGAVGKTVVYTEPIEAKVADGADELKALVGELNAGAVKTLVLLGGNPAYNAPADLNFATALQKAATTIRLGLYEDETSGLCQWHLPESHPLESWGDARAYDGTVTIVQPLIQPLYSTRSALEVVSELLDQPLSGLDLVRAQWKSLSDAAWGKALSDGLVPNTALPTLAVTLKPDFAAALPAAPSATGLEIGFRPDPTLWDGRYASNSWLQELPKPVTTIVWDNAAVISPATAKKLGVMPAVGESDAVNIAQYTGKQLIQVSVGKANVKVPAWILPGQPDDTITLYLGGGRTRGGAVAVGRGFDTYAVRNTDGLSSVSGVSAKVTGESYELVYTQPHHMLKAEYSESKNRDIVRAATLEEFIARGGKIGEVVMHHSARAGDPEHAAGHDDGEHGVKQGEAWNADPRGTWQYTDKSVANKENNASLYPEFSNKDYNQWAMSIDLTTCIGCNACTIACQAENNIPTIGKEQVARGREMHWIRMDHYYETDQDLSHPVSHFMPVPCMQCEKAPCEPVCPVAATIHSHEGLNQMVYNRCIGTRYCSNNCPYKVRRFNFLKWTEGTKIATGTLDYYNKPQLKMLANPHVSVRGRGVMEKCTYCVQRINEVRIEAKKEGREIQDGEIITACQQVCPTQAIVFGDINNPESRVSKLKAQPHDYALLADLNTRPRTTYLAKVRNPNRDLEKA